MIHPSRRYEEQTTNRLKESGQTRDSIQQIVQNTECRICLETQAQNPDKHMIAPCRCIGSVKYVHEECLRSWIISSMNSKTRKERKLIGKQGLSCQMCKQNMKFEHQMKFGCRPCSEIKILWEMKKIILIVIILLIGISVTGITFALINLIALSLELQLFQAILTMVGIVLLGFFFVLGVYVSIVEFYLKTESEVGKIIVPETKRKLNSSNISIIDIV